MLYLARFQSPEGETLAPILLSAPDADAAAAHATIAADGLAPAELHEVPDGLFVAEVRFADALDDDGEPENNPANFSPALLVLEPFEPLADWLTETDGAPVVADDDG